jgi:DNA anti-recombination protein RmuC
MPIHTVERIGIGKERTAMKSRLLAGLFGLLFALSALAQEKDKEKEKEKEKDKAAVEEKETHDAYAEESLNALDRIADVLGDVRDSKSAADARAKLPELSKSLAELKKKATALGDPTKEQKSELDKKYKAKFEASLRRFRTEAVRVGTAVEGGKELLDEFDKLVRPLTTKKK